jgi:hypothetical protein
MSAIEGLLGAAWDLANTQGISKEVWVEKMRDKLATGARIALPAEQDFAERFEMKVGEAAELPFDEEHAEQIMEMVRAGERQDVRLEIIEILKGVGL